MTSRPLPVPVPVPDFGIPDAVLAQHTAILGKTGSGKTTTGKLCIEQVVAEDYRVCIIDPVKSDWWGLTSSADGKRPGLPFTILGGEHGHVPLHYSSGKAIADVVANGSLRLSILDMKHFPPGKAQHFFVDFIPRLLQKMKGVLYLVIEEAHEFAPKERAGFEKENMSIHYAKALATSGRTYGIRLIVLTQRTQSLHNAVLGSCDSVIAHRMTKAEDQEAVIKWLKSNVKDKERRDEIAGSLGSLKTGTGWLCSMEAKILQLTEFPKAETFDNTKTPDKDDDVAQVVKTATVDTAALKAIIGEAVKEAEANDPTLLKAKISELEAKISEAAGREARAAVAETIRQESEPKGCQIDHEALVREGVKQGYQLGVEASGEGLEKAISTYCERVRDLIAKVQEDMPDVAADVFATPDLLMPTVAQQRAISEKLLGTPVLMGIPVRTAVDMPRDTMNIVGGGSGGGDGVALYSVAHPKAKGPRPKATINPKNLETIEIEVLGTAEATFLNALEQRIGRVTTRNQLALLTLYSATSRHVDNTLGSLRAAGYVEGPGTNIQITQAGVAALVKNRARRLMPTGAGLREAWLAKSGKAEAGFLTFLIHKYPRTVTREELALATNYSPTSRHVDNTLGRLRALGLIVGPGSAIRASEDLFDGST